MFLGKGGGGGAQSMRSDGGFRRLTGEGFTRAGVLTRGRRILFLRPLQDGGLSRLIYLS